MVLYSRKEETISSSPPRVASPIVVESSVWIQFLTSPLNLKLTSNNQVFGLW